MDTEKLGPGSILIFFHLKNNRNVVPNIGDSKGGMKLQFRTSEHGVLGLVGINGGLRVSASLCSEWSESDMAAVEQ